MQAVGDLNTLSTTGQTPDFAFFSKYLPQLSLIGIFTLLALVWNLLVMPLAWLTCSKLAVQSLLNQPYTISEALAYARARYWPTQAALFIFLLPVLLLSLFVLLPVLGFNTAGNDAGTLTSAIAALFVIMFGALATVLLWYRLFAAISGAVQSLEAAPPGGIFQQGMWYLRRSYDLTAGMFWRCFGLLFAYSFAVGLIENGVFKSIQFIVETSFAAAEYRRGADWEQILTSMSTQSNPWMLATEVGLYSLIALLFPPLALVYELLVYIDLRCRKEGYDLQRLLGIARIE
jgi:hypothetical protein